jgi:hypothetical protein
MISIRTFFFFTALTSLFAVLAVVSATSAARGYCFRHSFPMVSSAPPPAE